MFGETLSVIPIERLRRYQTDFQREVGIPSTVNILLLRTHTLD